MERAGHLSNYLFYLHNFLECQGVKRKASPTALSSIRGLQLHTPDRYPPWATHIARQSVPVITAPKKKSNPEFRKYRTVLKKRKSLSRKHYFNIYSFLTPLGWNDVGCHGDKDIWGSKEFFASKSMS